jgi:hypothetical protein
MSIRLALLLLVLVGLGQPVAAQPLTVSPTTLTFAASADHTVVVGTLALVTTYHIQIFDGPTQVSLTNVGKPTPNAANDITVPLGGLGLPKNKILTAVVVAVGPGGTAGSTPSNPFVFLVAPAPAGNVRVQ